MAKRARKQRKGSLSSAEPLPASPKCPLWQPVSAALLPLLLYVNTFGHTFALDDYVVFRDNKFVQQGISGIPDIMTQDTFRGFLDHDINLSGGRYRPLSLVTFAVEQELWGGPDSFKPQISHAINALLYALTCLLIYIVLRQLLLDMPQRDWLAWASVMLFAVHPTHTEAVSNIKGRDDILCFVLILTSFLLLLRAVDRKHWGWLAAAVGIYFASLFSKESAVTFLAVFPACLFCLRRGITAKQHAIYWLPFFISAAIFVVLRSEFAGSVGDRETTDVMLDPFAAMTSSEKFATIFLTLTRYLKLLVFPHPLSFDYSFNQIPAVGFANIEAIVGILAHLGLGVWALLALLRRKASGILPLYYLATLSIVSNLVFPIGAPMADRFLYMPSLAFSIGLATLCLGMIPRLPVPRLAGLAILGAICLAFGTRTVLRNPAWKDNWSLVNSDVRYAPNSARVHASLGEQRFHRYNEDPKTNAHLLELAKASYQQSLEINPRYLDSHLNLGILYGKTGDHANAERCFLAAFTLNQRDMRPLYDLSVARMKQSKYPLAVEGFRTVLQQQPDNLNARRKLADVLIMARQYEQAVTLLQPFLAQNPAHPKLWEALGRAYMKVDRVNDAIDAFQRGLQHGANSAALHSDLGAAYFKQKQWDDAERHLLQALELAPQLLTALNNLASVYLNASRPADAIKLYRRALSINPAYQAARSNLPTALFSQGRAHVADQQWAAALPLFQEVMTFLPDATESHFYIGQCHFHLGDKELARKSLQLYNQNHPPHPEAIRLLKELEPAK